MEMWMDWNASGTRRQSVERGGASEYIYIECVTDVVDPGLAGELDLQHLFTRCMECKKPLSIASNLCPCDADAMASEAAYSLTCTGGADAGCGGGHGY